MCILTVTKSQNCALLEGCEELAGKEDGSGADHDPPGSVCNGRNTYRMQVLGDVANIASATTYTGYLRMWSCWMELPLGVGMAC